jgi:hypothetical protein
MLPERDERVDPCVLGSHPSVVPAHRLEATFVLGQGEETYKLLVYRRGADV